MFEQLDQSMMNDDPYPADIGSALPTAPSKATSELRANMAWSCISVKVVAAFFGRIVHLEGGIIERD